MKAALRSTPAHEWPKTLWYGEESLRGRIRDGVGRKDCSWMVSKGIHIGRAGFVNRS